jgi:NitT/TauT family transport system substrate-binding protein
MKKFLLATFAVALAACKPPSAPTTIIPTSGGPIRIGAIYWPGNYWVDIAHRKGWFKEAGLNVEWVDTNADYFASFDDIVSGKLDMVGFSFFDFVLYNAKGKDLVGVLATDYSAGADALVARPGIESVRDLAGKKVGVPKGTYLEYLLSVAAERGGLDLAGVTLVDVPAEKVHEELIAGHVDAMFTFEPMASEGLEKVKGRKLFSTAEALGINGGIEALRREFVEKRPADVQALLAVWQRTTEFIKTHEDEAFAIVAEVNKKTPAEVKTFAAVDKILDLRDNQLAFSFAGRFGSLHGSWLQLNDFLISHGMVTDRVESTHHLEARFLRELK